MHLAIRVVGELHLDATTTETGAYTLSGAMSGVSVSKNLLAQWYIPSENEGYKAAYYAPTLNSGSGGYWTYATQSNTAPGNSWALRTSANETNNVGFRVANAPEPASIMLIGLGGIILASVRRKPFKL